VLRMRLGIDEEGETYLEEVGETFSVTGSESARLRPKPSASCGILPGQEPCGPLSKGEDPIIVPLDPQSASVEFREPPYRFQEYPLGLGRAGKGEKDAGADRLRQLRQIASLTP